MSSDPAARGPPGPAARAPAGEIEEEEEEEEEDDWSEDEEEEDDPTYQGDGDVEIEAAAPEPIAEARPIWVEGPAPVSEAAEREYEEAIDRMTAADALGDAVDRGDYLAVMPRARHVDDEPDSSFLYYVARAKGKSYAVQKAFVDGMGIEHDFGDWVIDVEWYDWSDEQTPGSTQLELSATDDLGSVPVEDLILGSLGVTSTDLGTQMEEELDANIKHIMELRPDIDDDQ